jgi:hypothetical protein
MFHPAVVFKERDIIGHSLNPKNQAELVIHLDGYSAHPMFDTGSFDSRVEVIAHFILVAAVKFTAQECGDILGFNRVNSGADDFVVDQFKVASLLEDYISGVFDLHKAPVIIIGTVANNRTVLPDDLIQLLMNAFGTDVISKLLGPIKIINVHEDIIEHLKVDLLLIESGCQQIMSIAVELQPERRPCRHSQITQSQLDMDKVEVIMQALARHGLERCCASLFIIPGLVCGAQFHCREYMYKPGMRTSLFDNIADPAFFSEILFANKIDYQAVVGGDFFGICTDFFPQRICPLCKVEYTNAIDGKKGTHTLGITNAGYGSSQYDSVKAGDNALDFTAVPLNKVFHRSNSPYEYFQSQRFSEKYRAA